MEKDNQKFLWIKNNFYITLKTKKHPTGQVLTLMEPVSLSPCRLQLKTLNKTQKGTTRGFWKMTQSKPSVGETKDWEE